MKKCNAAFEKCLAPYPTVLYMVLNIFQILYTALSGVAKLIERSCRNPTSWLANLIIR